MGAFDGQPISIPIDEIDELDELSKARQSSFHCLKPRQPPTRSSRAVVGSGRSTACFKSEMLSGRVQLLPIVDWNHRTISAPDQTSSMAAQVRKCNSAQRTASGVGREAFVPKCSTSTKMSRRPVWVIFGLMMWNLSVPLSRIGGFHGIDGFVRVGIDGIEPRRSPDSTELTESRYWSKRTTDAVWSQLSACAFSNWPHPPTGKTEKKTRQPLKICHFTRRTGQE